MGPWGVGSVCSTAGLFAGSDESAGDSGPWEQRYSHQGGAGRGTAKEKTNQPGGKPKQLWPRQDQGTEDAELPFNEHTTVYLKITNNLLLTGHTT